LEIVFLSANSTNFVINLEKFEQKFRNHKLGGKKSGLTWGLGFKKKE